MRASCLLLSAAVAVLNASMGASSDTAVESRAIEKIELLGGDVTRDEKSPDRPVISVDLHRSKRFNDKYAHLLKSFTHLTTLDLAGTGITDAGLKEISELKSLKMLDLTRTKVTDAGVKNIGGLTNLSHLLLNRTGVSDIGLKELSNLTKLKELHLNDTSNITAKCVKELRKSLPNLEIVGSRRNGQ